jgi:hypothetical protein
MRKPFRFSLDAGIGNWTKNSCDDRVLANAGDEHEPELPLAKTRSNAASNVWT